MRLTSIDSAGVNFEIDRQSPADAAYDGPTRAHFAMRTLSADPNHAQNMHRHITRNNREFASTLEKLRRIEEEGSGRPQKPSRPARLRRSRARLPTVISPGSRPGRRPSE